MTADQPKPRFEPPPWEQEAFNRFQKERQKARASEELEEQLRQVRQPEPAVPELPVVRKPEAEQPVMPDAKIDSMLIQLRAEEPSVKAVHLPLVNGVIAFLSLAGLAIIVQSAVLFGGVGAAEPTSRLLAALVSFVVLLVGLGFLGGAFLLFRKYHR